jgi:hypothetical protein
MKKTILAIATLLTVSNVFADTGAFALNCTNTSANFRQKLAVTCNADGSDCLLASRSPNSRRGINLQLEVVSAGHGVLTLVNAQAGVNVVIQLAEKKTAEIFDVNGIVSVCE